MQGKMKTGELIRKARIKKGLTQLELAKKLGYPNSQFVSLFERGLSKVPNDVYGKLHVILGVSVQHFIARKVTEFRKNMSKEICSGVKVMHDKN